MNYAQYLSGMTEFPCIFPCAWHGQTFDIYEYLGNFKTTWTFNSDGQTSVFTDQTNNSVTYRCHQIMERFLILRSVIKTILFKILL